MPSKVRYFLQVTQGGPRVLASASLFGAEAVKVIRSDYDALVKSTPLGSRMFLPKMSGRKAVDIGRMFKVMYNLANKGIIDQTSKYYRSQLRIVREARGCNVGDSNYKKWRRRLPNW